MKDEADYEIRTRLSFERINEATAQLLFEALPWIKNLTGKTVVIKYGGAAMVDEQLRRDVMSDIVLLQDHRYAPRHRARRRQGYQRGAEPLRYSRRV